MCVGSGTGVRQRLHEVPLAEFNAASLLDRPRCVVDSAAAPGLLAGKVAFITGAGRGIGAAAVRLFARESARVLLAARTEAQLKRVAKEIRAAGGGRHREYVVCDLADATSVRAAVDRAVNLYGRLDIAAIRTTAGTGAVVNNPSVGGLMGNPELPAYAR